MNRLWSILFLLVPVLGIGLFIAAAARIGPFASWWLPPSIGPRTESIDHLFNLIHILLGVVLAVTGVVLAIAVWRFDRSKRPQARLFHTNVPVEIAWTLVPAGILVFLSFYQLPTWNTNKVIHPRGPTEGLQAPLARVEARQFGWRFVYPGPDNVFDTTDDIFRENELLVPTGQMVVLELESRDVIHSLYVPNLRLKQDIVPGLQPRVWFTVDRPGSWDLVCSELCGWGHYKMRALLVSVTPDEFEARVEQLSREQRYYEPQ